nr:aldo/keto reductase [Fimbriimonadaceae bacterium]
MIRQVPVPGTEISISRLVLGSVMFRESNRDHAFRMLDAFWELGGNAIDLAHIYNRGEAHKVVGEWVRGNGLLDEVVLYDKGCHPYGSPRFSPEILRSDLDDNLGRLGLDKVTSFTFHRDEPDVELLPIVRQLNQLKAEGKVSYWGGSNWTVARIQEFNHIAENEGLQGMTWNNPHLGLALVNEPMWDGCHTITDEELAWHKETQFPLFSWSSTSGGFFGYFENDDVKRVYDNE